MSCFLNTIVTSITGDCSNTSSGAFSIEIYGTAPDYTISWLSPPLGTNVLGPGVTAYTETNLSGGTYVFEVIDSCSGSSTVFPVSVNISTGTCASISSVNNTTCNQNNGSLTANTANYYGVSQFSLYELTSGFITSATSFTNEYIFNSLSAGTYYIIANDGGGCTGKSESCIVKSSSTLDFGFYVVNDAGCAVDSGAIYVTGLTGIPPYTYLWAPNGETTPSITGLTPGVYNVTITDGSGCIKNSSTNVVEVPPIGLGTFIVTSPSCFASDATVTVVITGGTAPYYYSGSNGTIEITFDTSVLFSGVASGTFSVSVTDAGLCNFVASTVVLTPLSFTNVTVSTTNSLCNNNTGQVAVTLFGGSPPYTYTLIDSLSNSASTNTSATNYTFQGLSSGNYTLQVTDGGPCTYIQSVTINNTTLYTLSSSVSGTTCGQDNGAVTLNITSGGTPPYIYEIDGAIVTTNSSGYTFLGLSSGNYTASVIDANSCQQILPVVVPNSTPINFILNSISPTFGSNGEIDVFITSGEPPFTLNWSSNVPSGQTGLTITGLSAGTYVLSVTDDNGCTQTRSVVLNGYNFITSYQVYNICDSNLQNTGELTKKGLQQMLLEGFLDLTTGDTNCLLSSATFVAEVSVNGVSNSIGFYNSTSLNDFPPDNVFYNVVESLLNLYPEIESVEINVVTGEIIIKTLCNPSISIMDATVIISVKIYYDINCEDIAPPVESPFAFTIDTTLTSVGSTGPDKFQIPTDAGGTYNFDVDWGDGNIDTISTWNDPKTEHTYSATGVYNVTIKGQLSGWTFNNTGDRDKLLSIEQWGILEPGNVTGHFYGCSNLDLSGVSDIPNLSTTNTLESSFRDCTTITSINNIELWDTSQVTNLQNVFEGVVINQDISGWDVSNVTDMSFMFYNNTVFNQDISGWNVSNVTNMLGMFFNASSFNQDISSWDISNVTTMNSMFAGATNFNQPLDSWDVSNITTMDGMFSSASLFNQPLNSWNVSNVISMNSIFANTSFNQPLNNWDVSNVTDMGYMFGFTPFNQDISGWDVSNVNIMSGMFIGTTNYNQPLNVWDVSSVVDMTSMFESTTSFNQPLNSWDVSSVVDMTLMFNNATVFDQDISGWDVSNVTTMNNMLDNCNMSQTNYENLLVGWDSLPSLQNGVTFGVSGRQYQIGSAADTARTNIITNYSWSFVGDTAVP